MREIVDAVDQLDFHPLDLPPRPAEVGVLMADADHFDVEYVINPHMQGNIGSVDRQLAREQWAALAFRYEALGYEVHRIASVEGLPDLVFTANQSFPAQLPDGRWVALLSHMDSERRQPEVEVIASWYRSRGATLFEQDRNDPVPFEGMGDAHWFPSRRLVIGGHGFRSQPAIYERIASKVGVPVVRLKLVDPRFYHLDTCLAPLDERTALFVPQAFEPAGCALLQRLFERLIPVPLDEAVNLLACNGHCPDQQHFLVQRGARATNALVRDAGFEVLEVDTSEFLKSGGSVFCMKLMVP